jgi:hypothetical protein
MHFRCLLNILSSQAVVVVHRDTAVVVVLADIGLLSLENLLVAVPRQNLHCLFL